MTKEELLAEKAKIKKEIWDIEEELKDMSLVSSVDFASMYPSIIRLLNASIENLIGFIDDDPVAYRKLSLSRTVAEGKKRSKELLKGDLVNSRFAAFVGNKEERLAMRLDLYNGKYDDASIDEVTETPFERYFLAGLGIYDPDEVTIKFMGEEITVTEFQKFLKDNNCSVSGSGAVYKRDVKGLIPSYLEYLFFERKKVKKKMLHHFHNIQVLKKFMMAAEKDGLYEED